MADRVPSVVQVDPQSAVPSFEQVRAQLAALIDSGRIEPEERLPTVRQLAGDLHLAVNTVARSYRELEAAGLVETRGRHGTFVAGSPTPQRREAVRATRDFAEVMRRLGIGPARPWPSCDGSSVSIPARPAPTHPDTAASRLELGHDGPGRGVGMNGPGLPWIATYAVVLLLMGVPRWRDITSWSKRARKLAARVDLALTPAIELRVIRYLRSRELAGLVAGLLGAVLLQWGMEYGRPDRALPSGPAFALVIGGPAVITLSVLVAARWPRWRASGSTRLAHLRRLALRDALTRKEWLALTLAVPTTALVATWTLWATAPTTRPWLWAAVLVILTQAALAIWSARAILDRPSAGSDTLDLAWDDALRLRSARELLLGSTLGAAALVAFCGGLSVVLTRASVPTGPIVLFTLSLGLFVLLAHFLKSGAARDAWRKLWPA